MGTKAEEISRGVIKELRDIWAGQCEQAAQAGDQEAGYMLNGQERLLDEVERLLLPRLQLSDQMHAAEIDAALLLASERCARVCDSMVVGGWVLRDHDQEVAALALRAAAANIRRGEEPLSDEEQRDLDEGLDRLKNPSATHDQEEEVVESFHPLTSGLAALEKRFKPRFIPRPLAGPVARARAEHLAILGMVMVKTTNTKCHLCGETIYREDLLSKTTVVYPRPTHEPKGPVRVHTDCPYWSEGTDPHFRPESK